MTCVRVCVWNVFIVRTQRNFNNNEESYEETFLSIFGNEHPRMVQCYGRNITQTSLKQKLDIDALKKAHS